MLVVVIVFPLSCFYSVSNGCYKSDYIHHFRWPLIVNASITWCNMLKIFNVFSRNKQKKKSHTTLKSFNLQSVGVFFPWIFHAFEIVYCKFIRTCYWNGQRATNALKKFIDRSKCGMNALYAWLPRFHLVASFAIFWLYYGINSLPINDLHLHITRNRMVSILNDFLSIMIFFMHIFLWFFFHRNDRLSDGINKINVELLNEFEVSFKECNFLHEFHGKRQLDQTRPNRSVNVHAVHWNERIANANKYIGHICMCGFLCAYCSQCYWQLA